MQIGQAPIAARGNLPVLQGKAKVGKSAVVASILGAALRGRFQAKGDTLGVDWTAERHTGAVIHLDTEQSPADWWALVTRAFARSGNKQFLDRLVSIPLVQFGRRDRLAILEAVIADQIRQRGTVDLVMPEGVDFASRQVMDGISMRIVRDYAISTDTFPCRIDVLYGYKTLRPQLATRVHNDA